MDDGEDILLHGKSFDTISTPAGLVVVASGAIVVVWGLVLKDRKED
jgi:hypothetical protein